MRERAHLGAILFAIAPFLGVALAFAQPEPKPASPATSASAPGSGAATDVSLATASVAASAPSAFPSTAWSSGLSPMPSGSGTPKALLPPGAAWPDPGPSTAIYPVQRLVVRFNHKLHSQGIPQKLACTTCHPAAVTSTVAADPLLPKKHVACAPCHAIDDAKPLKTASPGARCDYCHLGASFGPGSVVLVPRVQLPTANLKMSHKAHADKGIGCKECHGDVGSLELATRDQLPRMKGCLECHKSSDAGGLGKWAGAKGACSTCHLAEKDGVLKTMFPSGTLVPPRWLKNAEHGSDWTERHKKIAGADSGFCGSCHREQQCTDCHDGKVRPRSVHPNDWLNMHSISARFDAPKCASCHSTTSFCTPCHLRVGVAQSSPGGVASVRFHPPASSWSSTKRGPGHHSYEAQKNISACVSCHVERDCVVCHGTRGVGGAGASPHGLSFAGKCSTAYAKNPRPCLVCHEVGDRSLKQCGG